MPDETYAGPDGAAPQDPAEAALTASILHWKELRDSKPLDPGIKVGPGACKLCEVFMHVKDEDTHPCAGCPVRVRTGKWGCSDTPYADVYAKYTDYHVAMRLFFGDMTVPNMHALYDAHGAFVEAVHYELLFLMSLSKTYSQYTHVLSAAHPLWQSAIDLPGNRKVSVTRGTDTNGRVFYTIDMQNGDEVQTRFSVSPEALSAIMQCREWVDAQFGVEKPKCGVRFVFGIQGRLNRPPNHSTTTRTQTSWTRRPKKPSTPRLHTGKKSARRRSLVMSTSASGLVPSAAGSTRATTTMTVVLAARSIWQRGVRAAVAVRTSMRTTRTRNGGKRNSNLTRSSIVETKKITCRGSIRG